MSPSSATRSALHAPPRSQAALVAASGPRHASLTSFCHLLAPGDRLHLAHLPGLTCVTFCDQFCACRLTIQSRGSGRPGAPSHRFKCRSGSGRSVRAEAAETVSRIGHPPGNLHRAGYTGRSYAGMALHLRDSRRGSAYGTAKVAGCRDTLGVDAGTVTGGRDRAGPQRPLRPGPGAHGSV